MAPGHVFHPGHDEWHGQTVVVFTHGPRTVVGRWDAVAGGRVQMRDAAVHEEGAAGGAPGGPAGEAAAAAGESRDAWLARLKHYGIPVQHATYVFPEAEVARIVRLRDV